VRRRHVVSVTRLGDEVLRRPAAREPVVVHPRDRAVRVRRVDRPGGYEAIAASLGRDAA